MDSKWSGYVRNYSPTFYTIFDFSRGMIVLGRWLVRIGNFEDLKCSFNGTVRLMECSFNGTVRLMECSFDGQTCVGIWIIMGKVYCIIVVWKRNCKSKTILLSFTSLWIGPFKYSITNQK